MTKLLIKLFVKDHHDPNSITARSAIGKMAGVVGIVCNILLFSGKLIAGLLAGSLSIVADAVNNLTDASSSLVTLLGFWMAKQPADADHPYGHARYEYLSGLIVAALIFVIGAELAISSVKKIITPVSVSFSCVTLGILLASIILKLWMSGFFRALGRKIDSTVLQATAIDSRNDVIATGAVLAGCLIEHFLNVNVDGYVGFAVAVFILVSGFNVAKETVSPLLGKQADRELVDKIGKLVLSHGDVLGIHDLLVHDYGPGQCFASIHVELSAQLEPLVCHDILDDIECDALEELNVHLVIHYDPVVVNDAEWAQMQKVVEKIIADIHPDISMHDFRIVRGAKQAKLVFDLAVPYSMIGQRKELRQKINAALARQGCDYVTVIRFDGKA